VDLVRTIELLGREVEGTRPAIAAADAMHDSMMDATERYLGADLHMSNFTGGPVVFKVEAVPKRATLTLSGGTYALADKGRRKAPRKLYAQPRRRKGQRRAALDTPRGYRRSARGSRWRGFRITDRHAQDALDAGVVAAIAEIRQQVAG
jgi:hypothetical protein